MRTLVRFLLQVITHVSSALTILKLTHREIGLLETKLAKTVLSSHSKQS